MFFLIRTSFWLTIVLALVSVGTSGRAYVGGADVNPVSAIFAAQSTLADLGGFCERNPEACKTGSNALSALASRAFDGAGIVLSYVDRNFFDGEERSPLPPFDNSILASNDDQDEFYTGSTSKMKLIPVAGSGDGASAGTLTAADRSAPWNGSASAETASAAPAVTTSKFGIGAIPRSKPSAG